MFVCRGNICRSPMAEFILKDMAKRKGMADCFIGASCATSTEEIWGGRGGDVTDPWYSGRFNIVYSDILDGYASLMQEMMK